VGLGAPAWLAGAVGAVTALVAAAVVDRVFHARDERAAAAGRREEVLDDLVAAAAPGDQDDVLGLLRPDRSPVPFRGRGAELRRLAGWLADEAANPVLVICGAAGVGKSRLALRFASRLPPQWATGWLRAGTGAVAAAAVRACGDPAVVLVDDAEGRADLAAFLGAVAEGYASPVTRVVLLARSGAALAGGLASQLGDRHEWIVSRAPLMELEPEGSREDRERWFAEAVAAFAAGQGAAVPALPAAGRADADEPALVLLAQALLAVLGAADGAADPRGLSFGQVAGALMRHEKRRWAAIAAARNWGTAGPLPDALLEGSVTALALLGFDDDREAEQVLRKIAELRDATAERLAAVTAFVVALYPPGPDGAPRIRPGMIGEWFIVSQLTARPALARALLDGLSDRQAARALSFLAGAADRMEPAARLFGEFAAGTRHRILAAAHAALAGHAGRQLLDAVIAEQVRASDEWTIEQLTDLDRVIPGHVLLLTHVAIADRTVRLWRPLAEDGSAIQRAGLARALRSLSATLDRVGRYPQALAADEEAVALYRDLARDNRAVHQPELARAVSNLGAGLDRVGRYPQALAAFEEAVALYRDLARDNRAVHQPDLALAVHSLGIGLGLVGRHPEALAALEEAVALYRDLARDNPAVHQQDLARAVRSLGAGLDGVGRYQEALSARTEATEILRQLASKDPDLYQKEYQQSLGALRREYDQRGLHDEAILHHLADPASPQPSPSPRPSP
jgi:tetratricopeptide (TPR) repeat protein